jgi:DnaJ like chaperone protein
MGNDLAPSSRDRIRSVAYLLGVTAAQYTQLEALVRLRRKMQRNAVVSTSANTDHPAANASSAEVLAEKLKCAYQTLDTGLSSADEDIKLAYRRQMSRFHPDKLEAQGVPATRMEKAKERSQQIRAAYDLICSTRRMC